MELRFSLCLMWVFVCFLEALCVQKAEAFSYRVIHYDVESGLPNNIVKTIFQDHEGYVWFGTDSGFCRYDGIRFETFTGDVANSFTKKIFESRENVLYVAADSGIGVFRNNRTFEDLFSGGSPSPTNSLSYPKNLFQDASSALWIAEAAAVVRYDNRAIKRYTFPENQITDSFDVSFFFFIDSWRRMVVVSNRTGFFIYNEQEDRFQPQECSPIDAQMRIYSCVRTEDGQTFLGTNQGVMRLIAPSKDGVWRIEPVLDIPSVSCLLLDEEGQLYIGTFDSGLYYARPPYDRAAVGKIENLSFKSIYNLFCTREGSIWAASNEGAALISQTCFGSRKREFSNSFIHSVCQGPGNSCYASDGTSVYWIQQGTGEVFVKALDIQEKSLITAIDYDGEALYCGFRNGQVATIRDGVRQNMILPDVSNRVIFLITCDRKKRTWICVDGLNGVFQVGANGKVRLYDSSQGLTTHINVIREGPSGVIYAGGNGPEDFLFRYDEANDFFVSVGKNERLTNGLMVNDLSISKQGDMWLAANRGVWKFANGECVSAANGNDLLLGSIQSIVCDEDSIWVGTIKGLFRYTNEQWLHYTVKEGLPSLTFSYRARIRANGGGLFWGASNGIAYWQRNDFITQRTPKPVFRTLRIDGIDLLEQNESIPSSFNYRSFFEAEFTSLIFPSDTTNYKYRIKGSSWIDQGENTRLILPNLSAGQYTVQIISQKNGYEWSPPLEFSFAIREPLYNSIWAYAIYGVALVWAIAAAKWMRNVRKERALSKQALFESEERFRYLVQSAGSVFIYLAPDLRILEFNSEAECLFHINRKEALQRSLQDLFVLQSEFEVIHYHIQQLFRSETAVHFENSFESLSMGLRYLFWTIRKICDGQGTVKGLILVGQDVTELQAVHDEYRLAKEAAEKANKAKSDFLARMSHELRTPLNSVIGFSRILTRRCVALLSEQDRDYLNRITKNGEHLLHLINEILDLSRVEAGRFELQRNKVFLDRLILDVVEQLESQAQDKGLKIVCEFPPSIAPLLTDQTLLKQILINLIGNGIKFTNSGSVAIRILVDSDRCEPQLIQVEDTGIGIPAESLGAIFEAFQQVDDTTKRRFEGTGLGLTISKSFCEILGYKISVKSELNQGSVFTVFFNETSCHLN